MSELRRLIESHLHALERRMAPLMERRRVLIEKLDEVQTEMHTLLPELQEATTAAEAIGITYRSSLEDEITGVTNDQPSEQSGVTIKQSIRYILNRKRAGLNSNDLLGYVNQEFWEGKLDRTSFSPQLSRMKRDGEIDLTASIYTITDKGRMVGGLPRHRERPARIAQVNGAPDEPPSNAPDAGSIFD